MVMWWRHNQRLIAVWKSLGVLSTLWWIEGKIHTWKGSLSVSLCGFSDWVAQCQQQWIGRRRIISSFLCPTFLIDANMEGFTRQVSLLHGFCSTRCKLCCRIVPLICLNPSELCAGDSCLQDNSILPWTDGSLNKDWSQNFSVKVILNLVKELQRINSFGSSWVGQSFLAPKNKAKVKILPAVCQNGMWNLVHCVHFFCVENMEKVQRMDCGTSYYVISQFHGPWWLISGSLYCCVRDILVH